MLRAVMRTPDTLASEVRSAGALVRFNVRYWPTVLPRVHRGLRYWHERAERIPDPQLRQLALDKLADERFNTEVAVTFATLAPRRLRGQVVDACVALQVMYDYLDGVSEQPAPDPLADSRRLFSAFIVAVTPEQEKPVDYYEYHPLRDDGGYLQELVEACRLTFARLPNAALVGPIARASALRCGEAQTRTHAIEALGVGQFNEWASSEADGTGLNWWEFAAGATASILCVHALIGAAADEGTDLASARELDSAYLYSCALSTLLDSLIDHERDVAEGSHSFVDYYEDETERARRIPAVATMAADAGARIRHSGHHRMTGMGIAAFYLSAPSARRGYARAVKDRVVSRLGPLILPMLGIFRLWRLAKAAAAGG